MLCSAGSSITPAAKLKKESNAFDCPVNIRRGEVCFVLSQCPSLLRVTTQCFKYPSPAVLWLCPAPEYSTWTSRGPRGHYPMHWPICAFFFLVHHLSPIAQSLGQRQGERHCGGKGLLHSFAELKKKKKTITFKSVGGPGLYNGERKLLADDICWKCFHIGGVK